jgi:hypothetical protein
MMDRKLELVVVPVSDADRAKCGLGARRTGRIDQESGEPAKKKNQATNVMTAM